MTDFYEMLEVEKTATEDDIKKAYVYHGEESRSSNLVVFFHLGIVDWRSK